MLADIDEAFALLDMGLGAVFSASMARRAAVQRGKSNAGGSGGEGARGRPLPKDMASDVSKLSSRSESSQAAPALPGRFSQLQHAVARLHLPARRLSAEPMALDLLVGAPTLEDLAVVPARPPAGQARDSITTGEAGSNVGGATAVGDEEIGAEDLREHGLAFVEFFEDPDFEEWAQGCLGLSRDRVRSIDGSSHFRQKLAHQLRCWQAIRTDKIMPASLPQVDSRSATPRPDSVAKLDARLELQLRWEEGRTLRNKACPSGRSGTSTTPSPRPESRLYLARLDMASPAQALEASPKSHAAPRSVRERARSAARSRQGRAASVAREATATEGEALEGDALAGPGAHGEGAVARDLPERGPVAQPGTFAEPHRSAVSVEVQSTPEFLYLRRCELAGLVPCQSAWRRFSERQGAVDVKSCMLNSAEIVVVVETALQCAAAGFMFKTLDLGGNALTDEGCQQVSHLLCSNPDACLNLSKFSLAANTQLKMRGEAVLDCLVAALATFSALTSLDLSDVTIQGRAATMLASALEGCLLLTHLDLAGCSLGRTDQADCVALAALLAHGAGAKKPRIEIVDLSGNFFGQAGFVALAAALCCTALREISFVGNCSGKWVQADAAARPGRGRGQEPPLTRFHPIQILVEGLLFNRTLQRLDMSACGLGPDTAFVLEDALQAHPCIKSLVLMDNPLGAVGLRCIIRLVVCSTSELSSCEICGHRSSDGLTHPVKFRYSQPGRVYSLNLKYPHERATLRTLLRFGGKLRGSAFSYFKFDPKHPTPSVEKDPKTGNWIVPQQGVYNFSFQLPLSRAAHAQAMRAANSHQNLGSIELVNESVEAATNPRASVLLERGAAWSSPTSVTPGKCRSSSTGKRTDGMRLQRSARRADIVEASEVPAMGEISWTEIVNLLRNARIQIPALRFPLLRSMFASLIRPEQKSHFIRACSKDLCFNASQVSKLGSDCPDVATLIISSLFPSICGRTSQLFVLSNGSPLCKKVVAKTVGASLWFQEGNMTGKYRLNLAEPADAAVAESCLLVNAWEVEVSRLSGRPNVSQRGNWEMLRNERYEDLPFKYTRAWILPTNGWLSFDYSSIRRPPGTARPMPEACEVAGYLRSTQFGIDAKLKALRAVSVHMYLSAKELKNIVLCVPNGEARQDFFCMLHTRVIDAGNLLCPAVFYAPDIIQKEDRIAILSRIGHLHLLNPLQPEQIPFICQLSVYEQRSVIEFLVQLTVKEQGGKVMREMDGIDGGRQVPASWVDKGVPGGDMILRCTYQTVNVNMAWRHHLARMFCVGAFGLESSSTKKAVQ